jgi:hypothetical protein
LDCGAEGEARPGAGAEAVAVDEVAAEVDVVASVKIAGAQDVIHVGGQVAKRGASPVAAEERGGNGPSDDGASNVEEQTDV